MKGLTALRGEGTGGWDEQAHRKGWGNIMHSGKSGGSVWQTGSTARKQSFIPENQPWGGDWDLYQGHRAGNCDQRHQPAIQRRGSTSAIPNSTQRSSECTAKETARAVRSNMGLWMDREMQQIWRPPCSAA